MPSDLPHDCNAEDGGDGFTCVECCDCDDCMFNRVFDAPPAEKETNDG